MQGSDTAWYKNVLKNPMIRIEVSGADAEVQAAPTTDAAHVASVVERFRKKHGVRDVKKYYAKFDVAVVTQMR